MKESFIVYGEWERHFSLLSPVQRGDLMMAMFAYHNREELPQGDPAVVMAFSFIRAAMDENTEKWARERVARAESGRSGGLAKARSAKQEVAKPSKPSNAKERLANVAVSESVSESVSGSVSGSVPPTEGIARADKPRFTHPTAAEVSAYVSERHSPVDPQGFIDFYEANGWMVGKTPMKDWKAACRNAEQWERWSKTAGTTGVLGEADRRVREDLERMRRYMREQNDG